MIGNAHMETTDFKKGLPYRKYVNGCNIIIRKRITQSCPFLVIVYLHECVLNVSIGVSVGCKNFPKDYPVLDVCSNKNKIA